MWDTLRRWRTWIFNVVAGVLLILPDLLTAFAGYDWSSILPAHWTPWVTLGIIVVNILMRPRPAVLPSDPEARATRDRGW